MLGRDDNTDILVGQATEESVYLGKRTNEGILTGANLY